MKNWHQFVAVITVFIGTVLVSMVFGMLLFGVFATVCATSLLHVAANLGYAGVLVLLGGLLLECYALYERHRAHVIWLVVLSLVMSVTMMGLLYASSALYSC